MDKKEYQRLARNVKAKIKRIQDKVSVDVSNEIEIPKFEELDTQEKFDEWSDKMESFTDRNNKDFQFEKNKKGVVYSKAELERALELNKLEQQKAQEFIDRFKESPFFAGGKEMGYTVGDRMTLYQEENVAGIKVPKDFDIDNYESRSRLEGRLELMEEKAEGRYFDRSMRQMQRNFMKALRGSFNSEADDIIEMIDIIPEDDFFELFLMNAEFTFEDYASDGSIDGTEEQAEMLRSYLKAYFAGNVDMSLKGF